MNLNIYIVKMIIENYRSTLACLILSAYLLLWFISFRNSSLQIDHKIDLAIWRSLEVKKKTTTKINRIFPKISGWRMQ